jgi:hypothetical protein
MSRGLNFRFYWDEDGLLAQITGLTLNNILRSHFQLLLLYTNLDHKPSFSFYLICSYKKDSFWVFVAMSQCFKLGQLRTLLMSNLGYYCFQIKPSKRKNCYSLLVLKKLNSQCYLSSVSSVLEFIFLICLDMQSWIFDTYNRSYALSMRLQ